MKRHTSKKHVRLSSTRNLFVPLLFSIIFLIIGVSVLTLVKQNKTVTDFETCRKAGYAIMESYPAQCKTPEGKVFVQVLPTPPPQDYYGSSTFGNCGQTSDCTIGGCNSEICQGKQEGGKVSICIAPDKPVAGKLGYRCQCVEKKCVWKK